MKAYPKVIEILEFNNKGSVAKMKLSNEAPSHIDKTLLFWKM